MSLTTFDPEGSAGIKQASGSAATAKVTVPSLQQKKELRNPITAVTAYDYATARLIDEAGLDVILVGDSLAMVMQGQPDTLAITMDEMLVYTRGVRRAVKRALVVADMPFGSYQTDERDGVANAIRFVKEAGAEAVKIEGGANRASLVRRLTDAEIPVMGHIGLTPQSVHRMGGYKVQGKTLAAVDRLRGDALALQEAGCFSLVLEGMPRELGTILSAELEIPTIGIGAGPDTDGQILVLHDMLSLTFAPPAKFVRRYADIGTSIRAAIGEYKQDVESRSFPSEAESYHLPTGVQL
ncbi:3-methyl-2-oxobutanoate hydroxymethyltransferase [Granulicella aggregans]|uniref:3-methyl-2-oxobutanoate hydroxymethyltransferase n=1 Tax=Granulicella aggregans TaxID=474949 RepID=UPI0021DF7C9C|nr:3-methyl-2-oxobutanoate hydroxymethyltransferase [Granulicella aggregans]